MPRLVLAVMSTALLMLLPSSASARDYADTARNVVPSGQWGEAPVPPGADSQAKMYDSLTPKFDQVTAADLNTSFKSEGFGVGPDGPAKSERVPRRGVKIVRDRYHVPHITGRTRDDVTWAMGWILQEDRGLLLAQARYAARLAAVDAPNINAFGLVTGLKTYKPTRRIDRIIRRNGLRALRSAGRDGKGLKHDIDVFVDGINARLRAEKSKAAKFTRVDLFAFNALGGQIFGQGGGDEARRGQFYGALRGRLGNSAAKTLFDDLSEQSDADTPTTLTRKAPYARIPGKASGNAILDAGSLQRTLTAGASAASTHIWASNFLIVGSPALDHRPSAVRRRTADRLLLPRPDARGRHQVARPPGPRRVLARAPGDDPDRPRRGLRVEPHLRRLGPDRRVRGGPLRRLVHPLPLPREVPQDGDGRRGHDRRRGAGPLPHHGPRPGDRLRHGRRQARRDRPQARELRPRRAVAAPVPRRHDRAHLRHALVREVVRALAVHVQRRLRRRSRHRDVLRRPAPAPRPARRPAAPDARHGRLRVARHAGLEEAAAAGQPPGGMRCSTGTTARRPASAPRTTTGPTARCTACRCCRTRSPAGPSTTSPR